MKDVEQLSLEELIQLSAVDSELYCQTFFPRTVRQDFAYFHHDAWDKLESNARLVNLLMFRGAGKTTHCRLYTSKAIAYAVANTILYIGKSEGHAVRSTAWIKKQVEHNGLWAKAFQLQKGSKWQDTEFEILVGEGPAQKSIWIMAAGILGTIRGVNRDDYRPDLIVLDDVLDDENAHTPEQRQKVEALVYGALMESLAPKTEAPHAKMIALNTPQHKEDFAVKAVKDPGWVSAVYGCWTRDTANYPVELQESAWPERIPTSELRKEKHSASTRNMLSVFLREKECKLVSAETASFRVPWLKKYDEAPESPVCVYAIDPVPPPSDAAVSKGLHKGDFEAHVVWGALGDNRFLLDHRLMRGHEPTWTIKTFFELQQKWRPIRCLVESIAYQRTLVWILKTAMDRNKLWFPVQEYQDKRKKFNRITTTINAVASSGRMYIRRDDVNFLEQYGQYPDVSNDDLLDASSIALEALEGLFVRSDGTVSHINDTSELENTRPLNICHSP